MPELKPFQNNVDEILKAAQKLKVVCDDDGDDGKAVYEDAQDRPFNKVTKGAFCIRMAFQMWCTQQEMSSHPAFRQHAPGCPSGQSPGGPPPGFVVNPFAMPQGFPGQQQVAMPVGQPVSLGQAPDSMKVDIILGLMASLSPDSSAELEKRLGVVIPQQGGAGVGDETKEGPKA